jgi:Tfp pilus assembly protein PilO
MDPMTSTARGFSNRDVDLAAGAALLAIGGVAFWFGILPVFHAEDEERRLAAQLTASRQQLEAAQSEYEQVRTSIANTRERLQRSTVVLHTADGLVNRQEQVSRTVIEGGLELEQLVVGTVAHGELLDTIPLHITGAGDFPRAVAIMHELRARFPDMAITSFQLVGGGAAMARGSEKASTVRFVLDIAWYTARSDEPRS